jgi:hypothetical protein
VTTVIGEIKNPPILGICWGYSQAIFKISGNLCFPSGETSYRVGVLNSKSRQRCPLGDFDLQSFPIRFFVGFLDGLFD